MFVIDLVGKKFGNLLVLSITKRRFSNGGVIWKCQCDCGNIKEIGAYSLKSGHTKSCGCLRYDEFHLKQSAKKATTHGMCFTRPHNIWRGMLQRCINKNLPCYRYYGGRGIKVCDRWQSFKNFWEDMKEKYKDNLTINRINNDGNYEPSNCSWVTMKEQARNKRTNHFITYKGETKTLQEWADISGIRQPTIRNRLKYHWSIEDALMKGVVYA
jgi:hypothetical protein